jgi:hypothetical protein
MASPSKSPFSLNYEGANAFLGSRDSRKVRNNTYVQRRETVHHKVVGKDATDMHHVAGPVEHSIAVMLHDTDVVTYEKNGRVTIRTGGWSTNTTRDRINAFSPVGVSRMNGADYVRGKVWDGAPLPVVSENIPF